MPGLQHDQVSVAITGCHARASAPGFCARQRQKAPMVTSPEPGLMMHMGSSCIFKGLDEATTKLINTVKEVHPG